MPVIIAYLKERRLADTTVAYEHDLAQQVIVLIWIEWSCSK